MGLLLKAVPVVLLCSALTTGCSTLLIPVAVTCEIPDEFIRECPRDASTTEARTKTWDNVKARISKQNGEVSKSDFNEMIGALHEEIGQYEQDFTKCREQQRILSKMIEACNRNAKDLRPRILDSSYK